MRPIHFLLILATVIGLAALYTTFVIGPRMDQAAAEKVGPGFVSIYNDPQRWEESRQAMLESRPLTEIVTEGILLASLGAGIMIYMKWRGR